MGVDPSRPAAELHNRLAKVRRQRDRWARKRGITCYRVYDADLPQYPLEVDRYEGWVHVKERKAPPTVDALAAMRRLGDAMAAVREVLGVPEGDVFLKRRKRQRGSDQYEALGSGSPMREVREGGHRFWVNLEDYLDTGLFLDHRKTRALVQDLADGRNVLNLFCYTGTVSVYAAAGGARSSLSVDLSNTYLDWAGRNFELNGMPAGGHRLLRADCVRWLQQHEGRYGLIFLDPPTFSNSKAMSGTFDVQRDHVELIRDTARLLEPGGILLFTNNRRRFEMDHGELDRLGLRAEDITRATLPEDFARSPNIHNAWRITRRGGR